MPVELGEAGLGDQFPSGRSVEILVREHEPAGQRPSPRERFDTPLDQQDAEAPVADREQDDVDGQRDRFGSGR